MKFADAFNQAGGLRRLLGRRQLKMMRRISRDAFARAMTPETRETMRSIGELARKQLEGLPPTTFRCAVCARRIYSYKPDADGRSFSARNGVGLVDPECPEHGALQRVDFADWRAEWNRRGQPERLNWKLRPLS